MKKCVAYFVLLLVGSCQANHVDKKLAAVKNMPFFKILSVDSSQCFSTDNIQPGSPVIFMYFDPECEHCQWETQNIMRHIRQLQHAKIYLITNNESPKIINEFSAYFHLETAPNLFVGRDFQYSFFRAFSAPQVPYIAIYDSHRILKKIYQGETNIRFILNSVQE